MVEHDMHVGKFLALLDELGIADNTVVFYSTDNGPHYNTWPDAAATPFRGENVITSYSIHYTKLYEPWPPSWASSRSA